MKALLKGFQWIFEIRVTAGANCSSQTHVYTVSGLTNEVCIFGSTVFKLCQKV